AMIPDGLDDRVDAAVTNAAAFAGHARDVRLSARRAVERDVADDDVLPRVEPRSRRRVDDELAARKALTDVVVRIALELERHAARNERTEASPCRALERELVPVLWQDPPAMLLRDFAVRARPV